MPEKVLTTYLSLRERLFFFLSDEKGGERDTLTTLLMLALIIIPLVLIIITFGGEIQKLAEDAWTDIIGGGL